MKPLILSMVITLLGSTWALQAQNTDEQTAFDEILDLYENGQLTSAQVLSEHFLDIYPDSELYPRVLFNLGVVYRDLDQQDHASAIFKSILEASYHEKEPYGGIMEWYALYRHRSAKHLAEIYLQRGQFKEASQYVYLFDKVYPYQHFCGNELSADRIYTSRIYAMVYRGQGYNLKAITQLLPHLFYNGLASNEWLLEDLEWLLRETYTEDELSSMVDHAYANLKIAKNGKSASFKILGQKVQMNQGYYFKPAQEDLNERQMWEMLFKQNPLLKKYL
ncbi:MAG: hypothetical protein OER04_14110 [Cyclobacteriaceae bacterium]|nr:hypothetical protein [Cyclobacteriaceae bacterium]